MMRQPIYKNMCRMYMYPGLFGIHVHTMYMHMYTYASSAEEITL